MADDADEELDSTNQPSEEDVKTDEVEETDLSESEDLGELQEKNKRLFERAKKAEAEAKLLKAERLKKEEKAKVKTDTPEKQDVQLTPMDAIMLSKSNITEQEDIEEVLAFASFKKIPVAEALKNSMVKTLLAEKAEQRATADATNTSTARRGSSKPTAVKILEEAAKGNVPEDPDDLADAWLEAKRTKK